MECGTDSSFGAVSHLVPVQALGGGTGLEIRAHDNVLAGMVMPVQPDNGQTAC